MDQLRNYADGRLIVGCIYCYNGKEETRDHVPSKVFLDKPYPENLPVVPSCYDCNNSHSLDEEYLACLIECVRSGTTAPEDLQRKKISRILRERKLLRSKLENAKEVVDANVSFEIEKERVDRVILMLAKGHAAFEQSVPQKEEPYSLSWWPIHTMSSEDQDSFDSPHFVNMFGEVGSRSQQRVQIVEVMLESETGNREKVGFVMNDWVEVQSGMYRYQTIQENNLTVIKMVLAEYLACEVTWEF